MLRTLLLLAPLLPVPLALGEMRLQGRRDDDDDLQSTLFTPNKRRRAMQRVAVVGDYIYFNGGEISSYKYGIQDKDADEDSYAITTTLALPHNVSWDTATVEFSLNTNDEPPPINSPALWSQQDKDRMYRWGGSIGRLEDMEEDDVALWAFEPQLQGKAGTGTWRKAEPANADVFDKIMGTADGAAASCDNKGFWIGGEGRISTDPRFADVENDKRVAVPGMLMYDMETQEWANVTTVPLSQPHGVILGADAACVKDSAAGTIVIPLGGVRTSPTDVDVEVKYMPMDNITFWHADTQLWLSQTAGGDVPLAREYPCVVEATSINGTHEIFMYGGSNSTGTTLGDMYVLTLPGFQWFKVDALDEPAVRLYNACARVGNRQMLSSGGMSMEWNWDSSDPWVQALGIFDMTELRWKTSYDAQADEYESPQMVRSWYDNGGMASVKWDNEDIGHLFERVNDADDGVDEDGGDGDGGGTTKTTWEEPSSKPTNTGAIAGGVVGGVAGVALLGALAWFMVRRRNAKKQTTAELDATGDSPGASSPAHLIHGPKSELPGETSKSPQTASEMGTDGHEMHEMATDGYGGRAELPGNEPVELQG